VKDNEVYFKTMCVFMIVALIIFAMLIFKDYKVEMRKADAIYEAAKNGAAVTFTEKSR